MGWHCPHSTSVFPLQLTASGNKTLIDTYTNFTSLTPYIFLLSFMCVDGMCYVICILMYVCASICIPWCTCGDQRTTSGAHPWLPLQLIPHLLFSTVYARLAGPQVSGNSPVSTFQTLLYEPWGYRYITLSVFPRVLGTWIKVVHP